MNKRCKYTLLSLLLLLTATGFSQTLDRSKIPGPGPAPTFSIGKYESFELLNKLKVFVVTNKKIPRVAFNLVLDYTPVLEKELAGYVTIAGAMLRTGTKTRSKDQLDEEIDFIGASLNTSSTGIYAVSLKKHQEKLLELMTDVLLHPSFPQAELDRIKKETISGLAASKDEPEALASLVSNVVVYGKNHPYGEPTTEETVATVTLDKVKEFYNTYYRPNIAYLAIVGDISLAEAKKLTQQYFSTWKEGTIPKTILPDVPTVAKTKVALVDRSSAVQSVISIAHPVNLKPGPPDAIAARVTNDILGGEGGRLYLNLREKRGLTYGAYSQLNSDKFVGEFSAGASVRNAVTDSAVSEFFNELNRIRNEKVTAEELKKSKAGVTGSFVRSLENPQTVAGFAINTAQYKLPADYYTNYLKNVAAVTAEDVQATAKKYIHPENAHIVVVGNSSEIADKLKKFGEIENYDVKGNKIEASAKKEVPAGVTADQVIANYIKAIGGKENLMKIKDLSMNMTANIQGTDLSVTQQRKAPNKSRMVMQAMGMEVMNLTSDGNKAAMAQMGNRQEITGKDLDAAKTMNTLFAELYYDQLGVKRNLTGIESLSGKDAYKVELTLPGGTKIMEFYDVASKLKVKQTSSQETPDGPVTQSSEFTDYKEVNGVKFPHTITLMIGPQEIKMMVQSIEVNKNLPDSLFEVK
jgi:predicted Zn-dependent peptidase